MESKLKMPVFYLFVFTLICLFKCDFVYCPFLHNTFIVFLARLHYTKAKCLVLHSAHGAWFCFVNSHNKMKPVFCAFGHSQ